MRKIIIIICLVILGLSSIASGDDRALIIGIGLAYGKLGITAITGPERDVLLAKDIAGIMGYKNIRVIAEEDASRTAIMDGLRWIKDGVKDGGNAFIYYSGHGCQIIDVDDPTGCDETLVPFDEKNIDNLIKNKEIAKWLKGVQKARIVLFVDSCFSGRITRSMYSWSAKNIKYVPFESKGTLVRECGKAVNMKSFAFKAAKEPIQKNVVVISAAANNEVAYGAPNGSSKGSLFTQALYDLIKEKKGAVTFQELRDGSAKAIKQQCAGSQLIPSHPQIDGDPDLFQKSIILKDETTRPSGTIATTRDNRELFESIERNSKFMVAIKADKRKLAIGERIDFSVTSSESGYLNLVEVEPTGSINVVYPNKFVTANAIKVDISMKIPKDIGGFIFKARAPEGKSTLYAVVTKEPVNLFEQKNLGSIEGYFKAIKDQQFGELKNVMLKSIAVEPEEQRPEESIKLKYYGSGSVAFDVVK